MLRFVVNNLPVVCYCLLVTFRLLFTPWPVTRFAMHRKTNLLVTSTRSSVCCANLILGFSVNFVHKKHLAEYCQWTVTQTLLWLMSHVYLHIEVIVIRNIRYINFTYDKTYDTIINENVQEWLQFCAVIHIFSKWKSTPHYDFTFTKGVFQWVT